MHSPLLLTLKSRPMLAILYGASLALGLLVALPLFSTLTAEDADSLAPLRMLPGFDYTVYSDFMAENEKAVSPLLRVGRWVGVAYLLLSVFFAGGILYRFTQPGFAQPGNTKPGLGFRTVDFWRASSTYFGRYLRLLGVTGLFVFSAGLIWLVIGALAIVALTDTFTERGLFGIGAGAFGLFSIAVTFILCVGDYAKVIMFRDDERGAFRAFGTAVRFVWRNLRATYGRYWLLIGLGTGLFGLYFVLDELIGMSNWFTIGLMLLIQQAFILSRIVLKVWNLGIAYNLYGQTGTLRAHMPTGDVAPM
ncbi:hypothetical protein F5984_15720 [Rudanella paleaurantiibacter]|uniref:DUF975 family protein n=1 Tax=Rudanella paleaurantiibacter TaxID=2614655 RepID=A0A7J5TYV7_9BACT|nr:hypothetical protein [Rudanella paleaurantiibacter]KAB7729096.1 hypothetical protein F5984_15720 [Rudanella paleaurantiibacter]